MTESRNNALVKEFEKHMVANGLAMKTVRMHTQNVDLFLTDYLLVEGIKQEDGHEEIDAFFDFAIRKYVVSSQPSLRQLVSSIKKFYKFLLETNRMDAGTSRNVNKTLKDGMQDWLAMVDEREAELYEDEW